MKKLLLIGVMLISGSVLLTARTIPATISNGTTFTVLANECIDMNQTVVEAGATLVINAGAKINVAANGYLTVEPGATLSAAGTSGSPIMFTSAAVTPAPGDWYGIYLGDRGATNDGPAPLPGSIVTAGGGLSPISTFTMQHVSIAYAGGSFASRMDHALSLRAVQVNSTVEDIAIMYSGANSLELLGGDVNLRNILTVNGLGDGTLIRSGYTGKIQTIADVRTNPTLTFAFEAASVKILNNYTAPGFGNLNVTDPYTHPLISNLTVLHAGFCEEESSTLYGIFFGNNGEGEVYNGVVTGVSNGTAVYVHGNQSIVKTANGLIRISNVDFLQYAGLITYASSPVNSWNTVGGCSALPTMWLGAVGGGAACAETSNNFDNSSIAEYDASICYTCPISTAVQFTLNSSTPNVADADWDWVPTGDNFFDDAIAFRGAFQTDNDVFNWVTLCPVTCESSKPSSISGNRKADNRIQAFPNPVQRDLQIKVSGYNSDLSGRIVDLSGRVVKEITVNGQGTTAVSLDKIPAGSYFIQLYQQGVMQEVIQISKY